MGLGMMGALGGVGQAFTNEADYLRKEDAANAAMGREKDLRGWLLAKQEEFGIRAEARKEAADIRGEERREQTTIRTEDRSDKRRETQKDQDYQRMLGEAEGRRGVAVADKKAIKQADIDVESENIDTLAGNKKKMSEAGETDSVKDLRSAQADLYRDKGDALGAKTGAGAGKLRPEDAIQLKGIDDELKELNKAVVRAKLDPMGANEKGMGEIQTRIVTLQRQQRAILSGYRNQGDQAGSDRDPQKLLQQRSGSGGASKGGMMGNYSTEEQMRAQATGIVADPAQAASMASSAAARAKTPAERAALQEVATNEGALAARSKPAATARPAAAPATPVSELVQALTPAERTGRELDAAREEYKRESEPGRRPGLAAGAAARESYAARTQELRARIRALESQYQQQVGNLGGPAFTTARP